MAKPKPVPKDVVCSECGLSWDDHTKNRKTDPTPDVCVRLLKEALVQARRYVAPLVMSTSGTSGTSSISGIPFPGNQIGKVQ